MASQIHFHPLVLSSSSMYVVSLPKQVLPVYLFKNKKATSANWFVAERLSSLLCNDTQTVVFPTLLAYWVSQRVAKGLWMLLNHDVLKKERASLFYSLGVFLLLFLDSQFTV